MVIAHRLTNLSDASDEFIAGYASAETRHAYLSDLVLWGRFCAAHGVDPLAGAVRADVERFARAMEQRGLAPATVARRLATLTTFYRWCVDERLMDHSPAANVRRPRRSAESPRLGLWASPETVEGS